MLKITFKLIIFIIISAFVLFYSSQSYYGLPYFLNNDEESFLKSTLFFFNLFSGNYKYLSDPFFSPLLNFFLVSFMSLIYGIIKLDIFNLFKYIYYDPALLILFGRISSLLICAMSLFLTFLILKKLKISKIIILNIIVSLSFSFFYLDIAIVNGKNSYYLLFFLIQYYLFTKFYIKIEKFNKSSYLLIGFTAGCAWGVNYFCALVSIYSIIILHYKKFKITNLHFLLFFIFVFFIIGFLPSFYFTKKPLLDFIISVQGSGVFDLNINERLYKIYESFLRSIKILFFTEKFTFFFLIVSVPFYLKNKFLNQRSFFLFSFVLLFEPIILIIVASEEVFPQLKYFSASIVVAYILSSIVFNNFCNKFNKNYILILITVLNLNIIYFKCQQLKISLNIISANHNFYYVVNEKIDKTLYKETIFFEPHIFLRKNLENLKLYEKLHSNNLISIKWYQKDDPTVLKRKIDNFDEKFFESSSNNINQIIFIEKIFEINNLNNFFMFLKYKENFNYILIPIYNDSSDRPDLPLLNYVKHNFDLLETYYGNDLISARDIVEKIYMGEMINLQNLKVKRIGPQYGLFKINL
jgi:hypothetical protein